MDISLTMHDLSLQICGYIENIAVKETMSQIVNMNPGSSSSESIIK